MSVTLTHGAEQTQTPLEHGTALTRTTRQQTPKQVHGRGTGQHWIRGLRIKHTLDTLLFYNTPKGQGTAKPAAPVKQKKAWHGAVKNNKQARAGTGPQKIG